MSPLSPTMCLCDVSLLCCRGVVHSAVAGCTPEKLQCGAALLAAVAAGPPEVAVLVEWA